MSEYSPHNIIHAEGPPHTDANNQSPVTNNKAQDMMLHTSNPSSNEQPLADTTTASDHGSNEASVRSAIGGENPTTTGASKDPTPTKKKKEKKRDLLQVMQENIAKMAEDHGGNQLGGDGLGPRGGQRMSPFVVGGDADTIHVAMDSFRSVIGGGGESQSSGPAAGAGGLSPEELEDLRRIEKEEAERARKEEEERKRRLEQVALRRKRNELIMDGLRDGDFSKAFVETLQGLPNVEIALTTIEKYYEAGRHLEHREMLKAAAEAMSGNNKKGKKGGKKGGSKKKRPLKKKTRTLSVVGPDGKVAEVVEEYEVMASSSDDEEDDGHSDDENNTQEIEKKNSKKPLLKDPFAAFAGKDLVSMSTSTIRSGGRRGSQDQFTSQSLHEQRMREREESLKAMTQKVAAWNRKHSQAAPKTTDGNDAAEFGDFSIRSRPRTPPEGAGEKRRMLTEMVADAKTAELNKLVSDECRQGNFFFSTPEDEKEGSQRRKRKKKDYFGDVKSAKEGAGSSAEEFRRRKEEAALETSKAGGSSRPASAGGFAGALLGGSSSKRSPEALANEAQTRLEESQRQREPVVWAHYFKSPVKLEQFQIRTNFHYFGRIAKIQFVAPPPPPTKKPSPPQSAKLSRSSSVAAKKSRSSSSAAADKHDDSSSSTQASPLHAQSTEEYRPFGPDDPVAVPAKQSDAVEQPEEPSPPLPPTAPKIVKNGHEGVVLYTSIGSFGKRASHVEIKNHTVLISSDGPVTEHVEQLDDELDALNRAKSIKKMRRKLRPRKIMVRREDGTMEIVDDGYESYYETDSDDEDTRRLRQSEKKRLLRLKIKKQREARARERLLLSGVVASGGANVDAEINDLIGQKSFKFSRGAVTYYDDVDEEIKGFGKFVKRCQHQKSVLRYPTKATVAEKKRKAQQQAPFIGGLALSASHENFTARGTSPLTDDDDEHGGTEKKGDGRFFAKTAVMPKLRTRAVKEERRLATLQRKDEQERQQRSPQSARNQQQQQNNCYLPQPPQTARCGARTSKKDSAVDALNYARPSTHAARVALNRADLAHNKKVRTAVIPPDRHKDYGERWGPGGGHYLVTTKPAPQPPVLLTSTHTFPPPRQVKGAFPAGSYFSSGSGTTSSCAGVGTSSFRQPQFSPNASRRPLRREAAVPLPPVDQLAKTSSPLQRHSPVSSPTAQEAKETENGDATLDAMANGPSVNLGGSVNPAELPNVLQALKQQKQHHTKKQRSGGDDEEPEMLSNPTTANTTMPPSPRQNLGSRRTTTKNSNKNPNQQQQHQVPLPIQAMMLSSQCMDASWQQVTNTQMGHSGGSTQATTTTGETAWFTPTTVLKRSTDMLAPTTSSMNNRNSGFQSSFGLSSDNNLMLGSGGGGSPTHQLTPSDAAALVRYEQERALMALEASVLSSRRLLSSRDGSQHPDRQLVVDHDPKKRRVIPFGQRF